MKTKRFVLGVAVALCSGMTAFQAQACGIHFGFSLPFISFGIGLGLGAPYAYPACGYSYPHSAYAYAPSAYAWNQPANYDIPPMTDASPAPVVAQTPTWVPATPGVGHWVPDPVPYSYRPVVAAAQKAPASTPVVTEKRIVTTKSPEGIPVYIVSQSAKSQG